MGHNESNQTKQKRLARILKFCLKQVCATYMQTGLRPQQSKIFFLFDKEGQRQIGQSF